MLTGLVVSVVSQSLLPYLGHRLAEWSGLRLRGVGASVEAAGVALYVIVLRRAAAGRNLRRGHPLLPLLPWLALAGWMTYAITHVVLSVMAAGRGSLVLDRPWVNLASEAYQRLVIVPVGLVFAARLLPLFLRLPAVGG